MPSACASSVSGEHEDPPGVRPVSLAQSAVCFLIGCAVGLLVLAVMPAQAANVEPDGRGVPVKSAAQPKANAPAKAKSAGAPAAKPVAKSAAKPTTMATAKPAEDISGLPDVSGSDAVRFPSMGCTMVATLPPVAAKYVRFKLEFGPGKVQQIEFDDPETWSADAKLSLDNVVQWSQDGEQYMACLRTWRNQTVTALNQVIRYSNTVQDLTGQGRHVELAQLQSPLASFGAPYQFTCRLADPVVGEPSELEVATFDGCVQRHVAAHERFIESRKRGLVETTQRVIDRVKSTGGKGAAVLW